MEQNLLGLLVSALREDTTAAHVLKDFLEENGYAREGEKLFKLLEGVKEIKRKLESGVENGLGKNNNWLFYSEGLRTCLHTLGEEDQSMAALRNRFTYNEADAPQSP